MFPPSLLQYLLTDRLYAAKKPAMLKPFDVERLMKVPLYKWDSDRKVHTQYGTIERDVGEMVYRISAQLSQSICSESCGWMGSNMPFSFEWNTEKQQLVCLMPKKSADRMISMHMNCNSYMKSKAKLMKAYAGGLRRGWSIDELRYKDDLRKDPRRSVFPDW